MWFGTHLPGLPYGRAALIRILGALFVAAACFAAAMVRVDDPVARYHALAWAAAAHFILCAVVDVERHVILLEWIPEWVTAVPMLAFLILSFAWWQARIDEHGSIGVLTTLFGKESSQTPQQLRSAYERQIREAAGQEERHRLARDLHDAIKQQIFVVQTAAATVEARYNNDPEGARNAIGQVREAAKEAMAELEAMLDQLRAAPLEVRGMVAALRKQCEAHGFRSGARVEFQLGTLPPNEALAPGASEAVFRAAQEALANAGRHARAANVMVSLDTVGPKLELTVRDDGKGFDMNHPASGMGIRNMRERAAEFDGDFEIASTPVQGTVVRFSVPVASVAVEDYRVQLWVTGAATAALTAFSIWRGSVGLWPAGAMSIVLFARAIAGYRRTRERREVSR
jgi:signal transduction histidine kinase